MELLTIREAAATYGIGYEAMRRRVDRGTVRAVKSPRDGVRRVPRQELERAGLWPGSTPAGEQALELRADLERTRRELVAVTAMARAEKDARERVELAHHQARAEAMAMQARADELHAQLATLATAGPIRAWRLRRSLRSRVGALSAAP